MKIARLIDGKWQAQTLPKRWAKKIPATTAIVDDEEINIPEKNASIPIATNPELGWQFLQDVGYLAAADIAAGIVAPVLGDLPVCNQFQQIDGGTIVEGWVSFAVEPLPEEQLTAAILTAEDRLLLAAEEYQEGHPHGLRGTAIHLLDRLLKYSVEQAPKGHATEKWIRSIYTEQAVRVEALRSTGHQPDYDYSVLGPKPHNIAELMAEEAGLVGGDV